MIRNLRTNHYIKFGSAHFNTLLKKQETEGTKYFLKKDISKLNTAYKKLRQRPAVQWSKLLNTTVNQKMKKKASA